MRVPCPAARMAAARALVLGGSAASAVLVRDELTCAVAPQLPRQDSNLDSHIQSVESYHWTTGQRLDAHVALRVPHRSSRVGPNTRSGMANGARRVRRNS